MSRSSNSVFTMAPAPAPSKRSWRRDTKHGQFTVSTSTGILDLNFINKAFGSEETYWAKPLDRADLELMLWQSYTLGNYKISPSVPPAATASEPSTPRTPSPTLESPPKEELEQVGLARFIMDYVTTTHLTDVYVLPGYRKDGLGGWILDCCNQVINEIPASRRGLLMADPKIGKPFFERTRLQRRA